MAGIGRPKTGGRRKGAPNKRTLAMADLLEQAAPGWDPVQWMAQIAAGTAEGVDATLDQRIVCAREVAKYLHPQRKSVEHEHMGVVGNAVIVLNQPQADHASWFARHFAPSETPASH